MKPVDVSTFDFGAGFFLGDWLPTKQQQDLLMDWGWYARERMHGKHVSFFFCQGFEFTNGYGSGLRIMVSYLTQGKRFIILEIFLQKYLNYFY